MTHLIPLVVFASGILGLFLLDWDPRIRTSKALLIPFVWLVIAGSRNVGEWLQLGAPTEGGDIYLEGNSIDRNLLGALIALGVIVLINRRHTVAAFLHANKTILSYFLYCGVSLFWSDYAFVGFKRWIRIVGDLVMVLVVLSDRDWLAACKRLYAWAGFLLLPLSILLIRYYSELGRSYNVHDGAIAWTGVATTKNELGMICMIYGLASTSRFLDAYHGRDGARRTQVLIAHGATIAVAFWLLRMANSATSLACSVLGLGVLVFTGARGVGRRMRLVHLLVITILFVSFSTLFLNAGSGLVQELGRDSTLTGRTGVWHRVLQLVSNPLLGTGFESFWLGTRLETMRRYGRGLNQAHNGYLEIYLNLGWVGLTLLAAVIMIGYRNVIAGLRQDPYLARLRLTFFVVTLIYNLTEGAFKMRSPIWIAFLLAIVAVPEASERMGAATDLAQQLPGVREALCKEEN